MPKRAIDYALAVCDYCRHRGISELTQQELAAIIEIAVGADERTAKKYLPLMRKWQLVVPAQSEGMLRIDFDRAEEMIL